MMDFLTYDAKVAALIVVFYMFYRLLLARETFHRVNRVVLLATAVASFVLPLCVITVHDVVELKAAPVPAVEVGPVVAGLVAPSEPWWHTLLLLLYIIGVAVVLGHTLLSVVRVMLLIHRSEQHPQPDGTIVCVTGHDSLTPFSWMRYIVMNRLDYEAGDAALLAHERGHIRLRHSCDVLLVDTLTALQWFNPAMWMLRADLRSIHEYEADAAVLSQGVNARQYQYLLIAKAACIGGYSIANGISHSTLKNRITMMLHKKSTPGSYLKLLALLPIVGVALAVNARTVTDIRYVAPEGDATALSTGRVVADAAPVAVQEAMTPAGTPSLAVTEAVQNLEATADERVSRVDSTRVYDVVENMPQFPGGPQALFEFLRNTIKYPADAVAARQEGRVIITFVVDPDGQVTSPKVIRSVSPSIDAEALRVISAMPHWTPGRQSGKPVSVKYTIPVAFSLNGNGETAQGGKLAIGMFEPTGEKMELQDVDVEIDGKAADMDELNRIDPKKIESISVFKKSPGQPHSKIIVKLKK